MKVFLLPAHFVCLCLFAASPAQAAAIAVHDLPTVSGNFVKAVRYTDATGDNLILLTETDTHVKPDRKHPFRNHPAGEYRHCV